MEIDQQAIKVLKSSKTIVVVGLSDKPERPSYAVASYLVEHGYNVIPVNPMITRWKGIPAYRSLNDIPKKEKIDIVDIFRKSEEISPIVDEAIKIGAKIVWMQLGVINEEAAEKARKAGILVVMDKCIKIEHAKIKD